ncbi:MAG TPA: hypothetical protein PK007_03855, partial [Candidatus Kapabacteria bacterium]|nr:hypothetical protein [Candidatus Kapabacteria bacterium]
TENFDSEIQELNVEQTDTQSSDEYVLLELMNENLDDRTDLQLSELENDVTNDIDEHSSISFDTEIFDEELQLIDTFIPEEENYEVIYEAEKQIIQKAASLIAGDEHFSVDLPIAIENVPELPSFEFKGDLSSSLSDFLNKLLETGSSQDISTPQSSDNEDSTLSIGEDTFSTSQSEPSETELLEQFAESDFDNFENTSEDAISEYNDIDVQIDDLSAGQTSAEYEFDVDTGELVEQKIEDETTKAALEIYELNDELLSNMKEKEKKINVSDEEIDIDLLLLNKKEQDNEIR